jgi:hypothetical protein
MAIGFYLGLALVIAAVIAAIYGVLRPVNQRPLPLASILTLALGLGTAVPAIAVSRSAEALSPVALAAAGLALSAWLSRAAVRYERGLTGLRRGARVYFLGVMPQAVALIFAVVWWARGETPLDQIMLPPIIRLSAASVAGSVVSWGGAALLQSWPRTALALLAGTVWLGLCVAANLDLVSSVYLSIGVLVAALASGLRYVPEPHTTFVEFRRYVVLLGVAGAVTSCLIFVSIVVWELSVS